MRQRKALAGMLLALALAWPARAGEPGPGDPLGTLLQELAESRPRPSPEAWKALPQFLRFCEENSADPSIPAWFCRLSSWAVRRGDLGRGLDFAQRALAAARAQKNQAWEAQALIQRAHAYKYMARYQEAVQDLAASTEIFERLGVRSGVGDCLLEKGLVYRRMSEFALAVECLLRAQTLLQDTGDRRKYIACLNNLGLTYMELGDNDKALDFLTRGLEVHGDGPDTSASLSLKDNLATLYASQGRFQEALALLQHALATVNPEEDRKQVSDFLLSTGSLLDRMGDHAKARTHLLRALRAKEEMQEDFGIATALLLLGTNANRRGAQAQAASYLERGLDMAQRIGAKATEAGIHRELSELLEARGDARSALMHFRQYASIQDGLHSEKGRSHLHRFQLDALNQQHEAEVSLLRKDNQIKELEAKRQAMLRNGSLVVALLVLGLAAVAQAKFRSSRRMNHRLLESENKFRVLAEQSTVGIWIVQAGKVAYANPVLERMLETEGLLGQDARGLVPEHPWPAPASQDREDFGPIQFQRATRTGAALHVEFYGTRILFQGYPATLEVLIDISQRKQVESELDRYRNHLAELVEERTRELVAAQREVVVRERLSALGRLTATVAHELRNPLGVIRSSLFSMERGVANGHFQNLQPALALADRNITRCDNIIKDLLDFSRQRPLVPVPTRLDAWAGSFLDEYPFPEDAQVERCLEPLPELPVDRERLTQAVANVVENAVHSAQAAGNGIRLRVTARAEEGWAVLEVRDNGTGVRPEDLERIFEPLFSTKSFGCGLGLPVVKNVMDEHGGTVAIRCPEEGGAEVSLRLPLARPAL